MWAYWACLISFGWVGPMGLLKPFPSCFPFVPAELAYWAFRYIPSSLGPFKAYSYSLKRAILLWLTLPHCLSPVISQCVLVLILYVHSLFFGPCLGHAYLLSRPCSPIALLSLLLNLFFLAWFGLFCHKAFGSILSKMGIIIQPPKHVNGFPTFFFLFLL